MSAFEDTGPAVDKKGLLARVAGVPADEIRAYVYILVNDDDQLVIGTNGKAKDDVLAILSQAAMKTMAAGDGSLGAAS